MGGAVPELLAFYRSSGWPEGSVTAAGRLFELVRVALRDELPGLVLAVATIHAALVVYPFGRLSGLEKRGLAEPGFGRFTTPLAVAVVFIPAGLLAAVGAGELRRPAIDVLLPVVVLFFFRGLAIIRVLLDTGRVGFLGRTLAYVVLFQMPFPLVLALGGLFDEFLDVRGRFSRWLASRGGGGRDGS